MHRSTLPLALPTMPLTRRHTLLHALGLGAALSLPRPSTANASASMDTADAFLQTLPALLQSAQVPGLAWALIDRGQLLRTGAWGFSDLAKQQPMRADTLLATASVTKTFTATLLMQEVERGRCTLDDDAQQHLPFSLRNPAHPDAAITLRHLLTHSSSLADDGAAYSASYGCGNPTTALGDWLREALHGRAARAKPPFHPEAPGQRHAYSNVGFGLLGLVLEGISHRSFPSLLSDRVLLPLGMTRSHMLLQGPGLLEQARDMATPYQFQADGQAPLPLVQRLARGEPLPTSNGSGQQQALCHYSYATLSDGLLRSTAEELSRFGLALLQGGLWQDRRILREQTLAQMFSAQVPFVPPSARPRYVQGLAWRGLSTGEGASVWAHFGNDPGAAAALAVRPQDGRGLVMLANSSRARPLLGRWVDSWMAMV
jgi:CubicO group peptidase (beta-lactamase class C family)